MNFDFVKTIKKGFLGFLTGLAAAAVLGAAQALTNYNPVICTAEVTENCTPQFLMTAYLAIIPAVTGALVAAANWIKNRAK